ncbi:MAG: ATP-dependent DNA ligase [DPANN group archaeon]|nr:ATP-dependent DNA ligase [DPANN group archaeon]
MAMRYKDLVLVYEHVRSTTKRLEKTAEIASLLRETPAEDMVKIMLLLKGELYPQWDRRELGVAARQVLKALSLSYGIPIQRIEKDWSRIGDLGSVAEKLSARKTQATLFSRSLTIEDVFSTLRKLAQMEGKGTVDRKTALLGRLLTSATPIEAKYIIRTVLEELRVGIGEGTLRDAIAWAFFPRIKGINDQGEGKGQVQLTSLEELQRHLDDRDMLLVFKEETMAREAYKQLVSKVQRALNIMTDPSLVAELAATKGWRCLDKVTFRIMRPLKVMLAQKVKDEEEGLKRVGRPCIVEYKYDGFRMQIHRDREDIRLFTRRLEEVTAQFPEVIEAVRTHTPAEQFILDAEAVGMDPKTQTYLPFQHVSQRIKRKYRIEELALRLPVEVNVFDILTYQGKSLIERPFKERRKLIERLVDGEQGKIRLSASKVVSTPEEARTFYEKSLEAGNEGIMFKNLDAPYSPGSRVGSMVKLKPVMDTLDLVIIGAEWGEGKRATWLTSFSVACRDEEGNLLGIGKVGTGIKELESEGATFQQMTDLLRPSIIEQKGREVIVKPKVVVELSFEEIQKSTSYSSGYALRFPRLRNLREDRSVEDIADLATVEDLYFSQK